MGSTQSLDLSGRGRAQKEMENLKTPQENERMTVVTPVENIPKNEPNRRVDNSENIKTPQEDESINEEETNAKEAEILESMTQSPQNSCVSFKFSIEDANVETEEETTNEKSDENIPEEEDETISDNTNKAENIEVYGTENMEKGKHVETSDDKNIENIEKLLTVNWIYNSQEEVDEYTYEEDTDDIAWKLSEPGELITIRE